MPCSPSIWWNVAASTYSRAASSGRLRSFFAMKAAVSRCLALMYILWSRCVCASDAMMHASIARCMSLATLKHVIAFSYSE